MSARPLNAFEVLHATMHPQGRARHLLSPEQRWEVAALCDGYGPGSGARIARARLAFDWNLVIDSTASAWAAALLRVRALLGPAGLSRAAEFHRS